MKFRLSQLLLITLVAAIVFSGCREEEDTNAPQFTSASVNLEDNSGVVQVAAGTTMTIKASFEDDVELSLYDIDLAADFTPSTGTAFSFSEQGPLENTSDQIQINVDVPDDAIAGPYSLSINAVDAAGNISGQVVFTVAITNPDQASIEITDPIPSDTIEAALTDTVTFTGTVSHAVDLVTIDIVAEPAPQEGELVASGPIYDVTFVLPGDSDTSWDFIEMANLEAELIIPFDAQLGAYHVTIYVESSDGHIAVLQMEMSVEW